MRPGQQQRDLCWGDLELKTNADGLRYVKFSTERKTKTRTLENTRNFRESKPKIFENLDNNDRCPVTAYLAYKQHRPPEMMADDSPFYLAVNCRSSEGREEMVQKLVDNNIPPNEIVQITGHKNVNSLNNYSAISDRRQQYISTVLSRRGKSSTSVATSSSPKVTVDEFTSVSTVQPSTSAGTLPFLYQCQVGTVNYSQIRRIQKAAILRKHIGLKDGELLLIVAMKANKLFFGLFSCLFSHFVHIY